MNIIFLTVFKQYPKKGGGRGVPVLHELHIHHVSSRSFVKLSSILPFHHPYPSLLLHSPWHHPCHHHHPGQHESISLCLPWESQTNPSYQQPSFLGFYQKLVCGKTMYLLEFIDFHSLCSLKANFTCLLEFIDFHGLSLLPKKIGWEVEMKNVNEIW